MDFRHFESASHAAVYNKFRPLPPQELVSKIITFLRDKHQGSLESAVDVGCGAGQSTKVLAPYFKKVIGFDPSSSQVIEAQTNNGLSNIKYQVGSAETIDMGNSSTQLVTASQSCQWFDLSKFYAETERILVPGGVLAMYGYLLPRPRYGIVHQDLSAMVDKFYNVTLCDYLFPANFKVLQKYSGGDFDNCPFSMIRDETIFTETNASLADLIGYMSSWSAFQNYIKKEGEEKSRVALHTFESEFKDKICSIGLSSHDIPLTIRHEYFLIMGAKPSK